MEVLVKYLTNSQHRAQACGSQLEESYRNAIDRKPSPFLLLGACNIIFYQV